MHPKTNSLMLNKIPTANRMQPIRVIAPSGPRSEKLHMEIRVYMANDAYNVNIAKTAYEIPATNR